MSNKSGSSGSHRKKTKAEKKLISKYVYDFIYSKEEEELEVHERKKLKKLKAMRDSSEEEDEDDEERYREELKDLIDDNPIEEDNSDGDDSDESGSSKKRKKHDDDDDELDDRLEDEDYDLIEENLGYKVERRKRFKRLRRIHDEESDGEDEVVDEVLAREAIAGQLFEEDDNYERRSEQPSVRGDPEAYDDGEETESDADDFIVDDEGRPIAEKKKKRKPIFTDASLQEGQDIFGVDFDYDEFTKFDEDEEYEDESEGEDYDEDGEGQRVKKKPKKKVTKKTIFDIYEPSELKRGHFTDLDNEIRKTDIPERMQLRQVPVTAIPEGSIELDDEAEWIYRQAFCKKTVSQQEKLHDGARSERFKKPASTIVKIKQVLDFIRNQQLEIPFIAFYRKEYVRPELSCDDLWKIYAYDERWCQLLSRKKKLNDLFEKMRNYQLNTLMNDMNASLPDDIRIIKDQDFDKLNEVQTMEELKDVHLHFLLHYSHDIPKMQEELRKKEHDEKLAAREEQRRKNLENGDAETLGEEDDDDLDNEPEEQLKQATNTGPYEMCRKAGILGFAKRFGLKPEQFAENVRDNYQRHEVDQEAVPPTEIAKQYLCPKFMTMEEIMEASKFIVARQLASEPLLRKCIREIFFERAKINVYPTKEGMKEIDEHHPCYPMKYLNNKPVCELVGEQYLRLVMAADDNLLELSFSEQIDGNTSSSFIEEVKQLYQRDEFSKNVQEWNALRSECVELALTKMVLPDMRKELRAVLIEESKKCVLKSCCVKLANWLKIAPYMPDFAEDETYDEWNSTKGIRAMGIAYLPDYSQAAFCAVTSPETSEVSDYLRLPNLLKRKNSYRQDEKESKQADLRSLREFIRSKKPHVIAIGGESREALMVQTDVREIIKELMEEEQFPQIEVEIVDNELSKIYANSNKGSTDFREYPIVLKQAVSLVRRMQDPLVEFSQLCGPDEEILCLRYHTLQEQLNKEELLERLYIEFINRTNEVGVDINLAIQNTQSLNLVQFICGLGPRKGQALIKVLKQTNQRLENRTQLVTMCHLGPKVFINCSGFIKIDTSSLGDSTEAYVEVLDGSRVHPETYEWARKMAIDAMEYDDEETNPAGALEEILESPERLKDLDLDAFAVELERQGFGNKSITLYDIRTELNSLYKDLRYPYQSPNPEVLFDMLTKETPETFYVGKMVLASVTSIVYKKPQIDILDNANPLRIEGTHTWQCPFCLKRDFPELSEVWNHFDANDCPGQATGIRLRLDNGLSGFIHIKNISDKHVRNPDERVQAGQAIHVRIIKIDVDRFSADCSSKSSDLMDKNHEWRPRRDRYYDYEAEERDLRKEKEKAEQKQKQQYLKRVIIHPSFHNKSYLEVLKVMEKMDQGEVIVRPSSKGCDHLTVTWKVTKDIYQHIDVREEGKENAFSLGQTLWIGSNEFEDLDEIIARHVNPMAAYARELLTYKYYRDTGGGHKDKMEEILRAEKAKDPKKIHYFLSASKNYPGKFLLSYLPRTKFRHEYVTVEPEGFRYRGNIFDSLQPFLRWFKDHYMDPIQPTSTTPMSTPLASVRTTSIYNTPRAPSDSRSSIHTHQTTQSVPSRTPYYPSTPGYQTGYVNTPYTPSGQTPFMTPFNTPHASQTPRYSHTPSPSSSTSNIYSGGGGNTSTAIINNTSGSSRASNMNSQQYHHRHNRQNKISESTGSMMGPPPPPNANVGGSSSSANYGISPRYDVNSYGKSSANTNNSNVSGGSRSAYASKESLEWQMASDSWARRKPSVTASPAAAAQSPAVASPSVSVTALGSYVKPSSSSASDRTTALSNDYYSTGRATNNYQSVQSSQYGSRTPSQQQQQTFGAMEDVYRPDRSPKSVRSTPRTNTSPHSMNLGDATPLYDEN